MQRSEKLTKRQINMTDEVASQNFDLKISGGGVQDEFQHSPEAWRCL